MKVLPAIFRVLLAMTQALFALGCLRVAFCHDRLTSGDPQIDGAAYALAAIACGASALNLIFGDIG